VIALVPFVLHESISHLQMVGVLLALGAVVCLSA
jgi:hypothetical protein